MSYSVKVDHQKLLEEIQSYFRKHLPKHIAIGTLDNRTQYICGGKQRISNSRQESC